MQLKYLAFDKTCQNWREVETELHTRRTDRYSDQLDWKYLYFQIIANSNSVQRDVRPAAAANLSADN